VRCQRVIGELSIYAGAAARRQAGILLQGLGEGPMQPGALTRQQLIMRGLLQKCVPESVAVAVGVRNQCFALHRGSKTRLQLSFAKLGNDLQQAMIDPTPGRGGDPQDLLCRLREALQPRRQNVAKSQRHPSLCWVARRQQLFDVERVALRSGHDREGFSGLRLATPNRGEELHHLTVIQRPQLDPLDERQPGQFSEDRT
jgi:hypothetical protein